ncbi:MAG: hypothetical protein AAGE84_28670 [Cyanobacteria bacterium P01_G01_bin.39]
MSDNLYQMNPRSRFSNRADEFTRQHGQIITQASGKNPIHSRLNGNSFELINSWFPRLKADTFAYQQAMTKEELVGLALSASYIPKEGKVHQQLLNSLTNLHQVYSDERGLVDLQYKTSIYSIFY